MQDVANKKKFEATLKPRVSVAIEDWHATQPDNFSAPEIIEHPVDPALQSGESSKLGGAMEIKAPWRE